MERSKWYPENPSINDKQLFIHQINNTFNDEKLTIGQEKNLKRNSLVNLFSQSLKSEKNLTNEYVQVVEFGNTLGPFVKDQLKPFGPMVSKDNFGGQSQRNNKDSYILGPISEGEDSEIEIERQES